MNNRWDSIYETGAYKKQWDYKYPSQELVAIVAALGVPEAGVALDIGCGAGRDGIFLAQCGYGVVAVTKEQIENFFPDSIFKRGPFLPLAMVSDAGELEGNIVVLHKIA